MRHVFQMGPASKILLRNAYPQGDSIYTLRDSSCPCAFREDLKSGQGRGESSADSSPECYLRGWVLRHRPADVIDPRDFWHSFACFTPTPNTSPPISARFLAYIFLIPGPSWQLQPRRQMVLHADFTIYYISVRQEVCTGGAEVSPWLKTAVHAQANLTTIERLELPAST